MVLKKGLTKPHLYVILNTEREVKKMFKRKYRVETIVTQKNGLVYKTSHITKMSRKEAEKLANTKKFGVLDTTKGYKWIVYNVIDL